MFFKMGMSSLHSQVLGMFNQLDLKFHKCWFDNLYLSEKFVKASYVHPKKVRISGPTCKAGRGLPSCVLQEEKKGAAEIRQARGTVKAAVLDGDPEVPDLVVLSYYDQKPVHFLSTICKEIKWVVKERLVYCVETGGQQTLQFLRLNVNDDYNEDMGGADIADQLRNQYRFDHWMRKRKWWWLFYFWGIGVLLVNAYVCYRKHCRLNNVKSLSYYEFRYKITLAWMDPSNHWKLQFQKPKIKDTVVINNSVSGKKLATTDTTGSTKRAKATKRKLSSKESVGSESSCSRKVARALAAPRVNNKTLDPQTGQLRDRLAVGRGLHMPGEPWAKKAQCALHIWGAKDKKQAKFLRC